MLLHLRWLLLLHGKPAAPVAVAIAVVVAVALVRAGVVTQRSVTLRPGTLMP